MLRPLATEWGSRSKQHTYSIQGGFFVGDHASVENDSTSPMFWENVHLGKKHNMFHWTKSNETKKHWLFSVYMGITILPLGGGFKYFLFSPRTLGKINQFWLRFFQRGLVKNHQQVAAYMRIYFINHEKPVGCLVYIYGDYNFPYMRDPYQTWHEGSVSKRGRRKIVGQILPCIMMSYMCMLCYKGAMLQAPPIGLMLGQPQPKIFRLRLKG